MSIKEFVDAIIRGDKEVTRADDPQPERAFDCVCCGAHFVPTKSQWIFHKLCDDCFDEFDHQKMAARYKWLENPTAERDCKEESVEWWMKNRPGSQ